MAEATRTGSLLRFLPALVWMAFIFVMSALPNLSVPPTPSGWSPPERPVKKVAHLMEYAVLGALVSRGLGRPGGRALIAAALITALYGASDEVHQIWVPTRHARVFDAFVDTLGGLIGVLAWQIAAQLRLRRSSEG